MVRHYCSNQILFRIFTRSNASITGGSIHSTINNNFCENWVFSLKMYQFVREIWVAAHSQRRRNNVVSLQYNAQHARVIDIDNMEKRKRVTGRTRCKKRITKIKIISHVHIWPFKIVHPLWSLTIKEERSRN